MITISKKEKIELIPYRWKQQYCNKDVWMYGADKIDIYKKLSQTNPLTEELVNQIIGNKSWTENICDECGKDSDVLIQLGQELYYESATACICKDCLDKAIKLAASFL